MSKKKINKKKKKKLSKYRQVMTMFQYQECSIQNFELLAVSVCSMHQLANPRTVMIVNVFPNHRLDSLVLFPYLHLTENRCAEDLCTRNKNFAYINKSFYHIFFRYFTVFNFGFTKKTLYFVKVVPFIIEQTVGHHQFTKF